MQARVEHALLRVALVSWWLLSGRAYAELTETEIADVTAEVAELRTDGGVLHLAVRYKNNGAKQANTARFDWTQVVLVDAKSKQKHSPIKDANGELIGGPIGDKIGGGRLYLKLQPGSKAWCGCTSKRYRSVRP